MTDTDKIFREIMGQASGQDRKIPNPQAQLQQLVAVQEAMDEGMMQIGRMVQTMGQGMDVLHFKIHMLIEILLDKGIVTKEELEGYKQTVQDRLEQMRQMQEEKMKEAIGKVEAQAGIKTRPQEEPAPKVEEPKEEVETSDVQLASEQHTKVTF